MQLPEVHIVRCETWQREYFEPHTPLRFVLHYELEYHRETSGISTINGKCHELKNGLFTFAKPGDLRSSVPPDDAAFHTEVVSFDIVSDPRGVLFDLLRRVPTFYQADETLTAAWQTLCEKYRRRENFACELEAYCLLLSLLTSLAERGTDGAPVLPSAHQQSLYLAICYMREHLRENLSVGDVARHIGYSPSHFNHLFKSYTKSTPYAYFLSLKISEAKRLLLDTPLSVSQIADQLAFGSVSKFGYAFKADCGETPGQFRRTHETPDGIRQL